MAKATAKGVWGMSLPRILNNKQTESHKVITAASALDFFNDSATRARLALLSSPARLKGCGRASPLGASGRSVHTASIGLEGQATRLPPAFSAAWRNVATPLAVVSQGS